MRACLLLLLAAASALASPLVSPDVTPDAAPSTRTRSIGIRSLLLGCLDTETEDEASGDFMSCISGQLRESGGELKLFPGVTLSSEDVNMSENGQRAISGHALKVALPWSEGSARFFGGWNNPSLVLSGGDSELDIGVEVDKEDPNQPADESGRGKKLKKILIPLMIGLKLKSALFSMLGYGAVITMAAKALLLSIVAVAIAGIGAMRRMYKDYSDAGSMHSYSAYSAEPSYSSYHHRSYGSGGGPVPIQPHASPSNPHGEAQPQPQHPPQQGAYSAHDMAFRAYLPPTQNNNNINNNAAPYGAAQ